jgi:hypothetical protein
VLGSFLSSSSQGGTVPWIEYEKNLIILQNNSIGDDSEFDEKIYILL